MGGTAYVDRVPTQDMKTNVHWTIDVHNRFSLLVHTRQDPHTNFQEPTEEELKHKNCTATEMKELATNHV